jgi:hypothetical protein
VSAEDEKRLGLLSRMEDKCSCELVEATYYHRVFKMAFIVEALAAGSSYAWIARELLITEAAVRSFYRRHNKEIGPKDYNKAAEHFGIRFDPPGGASS